MGKTQKSRRREFRTNLIPVGNTATRVRNNSNDTPDSISSDLSSLYERKRYKACILLASLYSSNEDNFNSLKKLTTPELLSILSMRLTDTSKLVQHEAIGAVRNVAVCKFPSIVERFIECGILNIILTLTGENLARCSEANLNICLQLLACMSNLMAAQETCAKAFVLRAGQMLPSLLQVFHRGQFLEIDLAIANLLFIATDNLPEMAQFLIASGGLDILLAKTNSTYGTIAMTELPSRNQLLSKEFSLILMKLKCVGSIVNTVSCSNSNELFERFVSGNVIQAVVGSLSKDGQAMSEIVKLAPHAAYLSKQQLQQQQQRQSSHEEIILSEEEMERHMMAEARENDEADEANLPAVDSSTSLGGNSVNDTAMMVWSQAIEILEVSAEILANLALCAPTNAEGGADDGVGQDDEGDDDNGDNDNEIETHESQPHGNVEVLNVLRHPDAIMAVTTTLDMILDMLTSVCSGGPIYAYYILDLVECVDRLCACGTNILSLLPATAYVAPIIANSSETMYKHLLTVFGRSMERLLGFETMIASHYREAMPQELAGENPLQNLINNSGEEVSTSLLLHTAQDGIVSAVNLLAVLFRSADIRGMQCSALDTMDAMLLQSISLSLCKGVTHADPGIVRASVAAVAALSTKDSEAEAVFHIPTSILPVRLNALLSNGVARKIAATVDEMSTILASTSQQAAITSRSLLILMQDMQIIDECAMCVIDLHTSDNPELLSVFARMSLGDRLASTSPAIQQTSTILKQTPEGKKLLTKRLQRTFKETLENVSRFLQYKGYHK